MILDDAHHLATREALHSLQMMMSSPPPRLRLVLATRRDPVLTVARMRLEEQLCELRAEQLRFSVAESALLLERSGVRLSARQIAVLHDRTGGWASGVAPGSYPELPGPSRHGIGDRVVLWGRASCGGLPRRGGARAPLGRRAGGAALYLHLQSRAGLASRWSLSPAGRMPRSCSTGWSTTPVWSRDQGRNGRFYRVPPLMRWSLVGRASAVRV